MQQKNKNDSVRLSSRYQQYMFSKRHLRDRSGGEVFPLGENDEKVNELPGQQTNTITARYEGAQATGSYVVEGKQHAQEKLMIRDGRDNRSCLRAGRTPELGVKGSSIRRLTPTECMRLQGFPDDWCDVGADGKLISDCQKYKMAGNAVTTCVVKEIVLRLLYNK